MVEALESKDTDEWETPDYLYKSMDDIYHFTLDVCATDDNAKCDEYYTIAEDGLKCDWGRFNWCNPPYSRGQLERWLKRAYEETLKGNTTVVLMPSNTDTCYFHEYVWDERVNSWYRWIETVYMVNGRLKFSDAKNSARFPSMLVVFSGHSNSKRLGWYLPEIVEGVLDIFKEQFEDRPILPVDKFSIGKFVSDYMRHVAICIFNFATIKYGDFRTVVGDGDSQIDGEEYTQGYNDAVKDQRDMIKEFIGGRGDEAK